MSCFSSDLNFCPECGSILPVPGLQDSVRCPRCCFSIPAAEFHGQQTRSTVVLNPAERPAAFDGDAAPEPGGPVVDRRCVRCGKEGMEYHTRQMRSADEGQTVFFTCVHCRFQEKEDS